MNLSELKTPLQFYVEKLSSIETCFLEHVMRKLDESSGCVYIQYRTYLPPNSASNKDVFQCPEYFDSEPVIRVLRLLGWKVIDNNYGEFIVTID